MNILLPNQDLFLLDYWELFTITVFWLSSLDEYKENGMNKQNTFKIILGLRNLI